jgi:hypothetical protein
VNDLNNRPRKILGWATPAEIFHELSWKLTSTTQRCTSNENAGRGYGLRTVRRVAEVRDRTVSGRRALIELPSQQKRVPRAYAPGTRFRGNQ